MALGLNPSSVAHLLSRSIPAALDYSLWFHSQEYNILAQVRWAGWGLGSPWTLELGTY